MAINKQKAFTILEVVVALTVLCTSFLAIFATLRVCSGASYHGRLLTQAVLLAETKMTESLITDNPAYETRTGALQPFQWQVNITPTPIKDLAEVKVAITWQEQQRPQQYVLLSFRRMKTYKIK